MSMIIERAFIMALLMSISGFVFCSIFLPFEKWAGTKLSAKTMVNINTVALFSFVIPIYFGLSIQDGSERNFIDYDLLVYQDMGGFDKIACQFREYRLMQYMGLFWVIGVFIMLGYNLWRYLRFSHIVKKHTFIISNTFWEREFVKIKEELDIKNVSLAGCCEISTPCTVGIWRKRILIPSHLINTFSGEEVLFILQHEFYHVAHRDLLRKISMHLLNCINWFNPLYYFLHKNLSEWMEIACDEAVTKEYSKVQKRKYCEFIIKVLELQDDSNLCMQFFVGFNGFGIQICKRRMMKIMNQNKKSSMISKISVTAIVFSAMFCGTAAAKEIDKPVNMLFSKNVEIVDTEEVSVIETSVLPEENINFNSNENMMQNFTEFLSMDTSDTTYTIIESGTETHIPAQHDEQITPKHLHDFKNVVIKEHKKNSDGSCVTKYYEGKKCTKCNMVLKGDLIRTVTDEKCSH